MRVLHTAGFVATVAVFGAGWCWMSVHAGAPKAPRYLGSASCASTACHGGDGVRGTKGCEFTTWAAHDPHARAYRVLFNDRSRRISKSLGRPSPADDALCLNCHVHPDYLAQARDERFSPAFGVGCESCHGPAERWLDQHHRPDWRGRTLTERASLGWKDTKSLPERVQSCVACHVGVPGNAVDHDLIAAGHPRLAFEFGAFHGSLPRHWNDRRDREVNLDLEARGWVLGQVESAQASLQLLHERASNPRSIWPEFAHHDCFACHHDLQEPTGRQGGGNRGKLGLNEWYLTQLESVLAKQLPDLADLRKEMARPVPDRTAVAKHAQMLLDALQYEPARLKSVVLDPMAEGKRLAADRRAVHSWDEAMQRFLGLAAQHQAVRDRGLTLPRPWTAALQELSQALAFPPGYDSPRSFRPDAARTLLQTIHEMSK